MVGRSARAALIAACTSRAAPLMSRPRPNCSTIRTDSTELMDVISVTSAILAKVAFQRRGDDGSDGFRAGSWQCRLD